MDTRKNNEARAIAWLTCVTARVLARPKNRVKGDWAHMSTDQLLILAEGEIKEARISLALGEAECATAAEIGDAGAYLAMALDVLQGDKGETK